jgi:glycosyltransferase involved in cell wall biosynthesis
MSASVIILTPYFRPVVGGVESNAERLARYFAALGMHVTVLTKRLTTDLPDVEPLDAATIVRIGPLGPRTPGGKWRMLPAVVSWLVAHRHDYDVVCSIDCRGVGLGALAARVWSGRPVVAQPQTTGVIVPDGLSSAIASGFKWLLGGLYARADAIACIARTIEREAMSRGIPKERVYFLPNAIDMTAFHPPTADERRHARQRLGVPDDAIVFGFVGRLSHEKGVMDLVDAWRLMGEVPNARLVIAGPDMIGHAWDAGVPARAFVAQHQLESRVQFAGPTSDVPGFMAAIDVAVQPSHFEALGLSAIEALACGVPVVASAVGGLLDFVVNSKNGLTCPAKQPVALASALRQLATDSTLRQRLAAAARPSVESAYDERVVFGRFAALVEDLAQRSRGAA